MFQFLCQQCCNIRFARFLVYARNEIANEALWPSLESLSIWPGQECFPNFQLEIVSKWKVPQVLDFLQWSNRTVVISRRLSDHSKYRCNGQLGKTSRKQWFRAMWGDFAKFWPLLIQYFVGRAKNISFWIFLQWKLTLSTVLIKRNLICALQFVRLWSEKNIINDIFVFPVLKYWFF